jgi:hypothetical protein
MYRRVGAPASFAAAVLIIVLPGVAQPAAAKLGSWTPTGSMSRSRDPGPSHAHPSSAGALRTPSASLGRGPLGGISALGESVSRLALTDKGGAGGWHWKVRGTLDRRNRRPKRDGGGGP